MIWRTWRKVHAVMGFGSTCYCVINVAQNTLCINVSHGCTKGVLINLSRRWPTCAWLARRVSGSCGAV